MRIFMPWNQEENVNLGHSSYKQSHTDFAMFL